MRYRWIAAVLLVAGVGGVLTTWSGVAHAAGVQGVQLTITPSTGLTNGQSVTITATGLTPNSPGTLLECDDAPNGVTQTSVNLAQPVGQAVSLGCTAPSFSHIASSKADGSFSATFTIVQGTLGPPCGPSPDIVTCPATDSAGNPPAQDAPQFPCPPTAAQAAQGYVCHLNFGDQAGDSGSGVITFAGQSTPGSTTPSTPSSTPGTTGTTGATSGSTGTAAAPATGASGSTGSGGSSGAASASSGSSASAPTAASGSGTLASTGPPAWLWTVLAAGLGSLGLGGLLFLDPALVWRRKAAPEGGNGVASVSLRPARDDVWIRDDLWIRDP
ncbi:MAG TPA: neocarzinostatin apoprotein domain-containing protein [Acidimicrobiales bacterium]|nr:neocarzinostatin apoprotein domain-containing protein [Acidimicrobiales bacterium]